jgi:hypothetical protein
VSWKEDVTKAIHSRWGRGEEFTLQGVYSLRGFFRGLHPMNGHVDDAIRRTLQELRDDGDLEFIDNRGKYRRLR